MPTTITGTLVDAATTAITSGTFVRFQLRGTGGVQPVVTGVGALTQGSGSGREWFVDFLPNASGVISGSVYSTRDAAGTGAGEITVAGSGLACWYEVSIYRNGKKVTSTHVHAKTSATLDIGNMTAITTNPVVTAPTGDTTYARLDGANMPFTGQILARNGSASAPGYAFATSAAAGFFQQASNVIGVAISGALKWLINSAGILFGSAQAIAFSSNADPSLAAGDSWLTRVGAAILGIGSTNGGTNGELRLSKVNKITITQPANSAVLTLADGKTFAVNNALTLAGTDATTHTFPNNTGTVAEINFANIFSADQTFKRVKTSGTSPTASSTGIGSTGSVAVPVGTDSFMILQLVVAGAGPAATGTITVTLTSSIGSTASIGMVTLNNADTGQWDARATIKQKTNSSTTPTFAWDNNGVALTAGQNYQVCIFIVGN